MIEIARTFGAHIEARSSLLVDDGEGREKRELLVFSKSQEQYLVRELIALAMYFLVISSSVLRIDIVNLARLRILFH